MAASSPLELIPIAVGAVAVVGLIAMNALNRKHTIAHGETVRATILHVEKVEIKDYRYGAVPLFLAVQVVIPRPDGVELVGVARVPWSDHPPEAGWTVPVTYLERFGTPTKVEIVGSAMPPR